MRFTATLTNTVDVIVEGLTEEEGRIVAEFAVNNNFDDEEDLLDIADGQEAEDVVPLLKKATKVEILWPGWPDQTPWAIN